MGKKNNVAKNTMLLMIMQISGYIFPFLTFPYLTRILGPEKYGVLTFVNSLIAYFQLVVDFGFTLSATNEIACNRNDKGKVKEILGSVIMCKIFLSVICFTVLILLTQFIPSLKGEKLFVILSFIPTLTTILIPDFLFLGLENMGPVTKRSLLSRGIFTVLVFVLIKNSSQYIFIPVLTSLGNMGAIILTWYYMVKKMDIYPVFKGIKAYCKTLKQSSNFFLSRLASNIYTASNTFILGLIYPPQQLAYFGASNSLINNLKSLYSPLADSLYPYMVSTKNYAFLKKLILVSLPCISLFVISLRFCSSLIIHILCGPDYMDSIIIFNSMLPLLFIAFYSYILGYPTLGGLDGIKYANLSTVYGCIVHLIGIFILFVLNKLTILTLIRLTILTQLIVLIFRIYWIYKLIKKKRIQ